MAHEHQLPLRSKLFCRGQRVRDSKFGQLRLKADDTIDQCKLTLERDQEVLPRSLGFCGGP